MIVLLHNNGHSDVRFNDYLIRAAQYYSKCLFSKLHSRNIVLTIKFDKHLEVLGYTSVTKRNSRKQAREFLIELHPYVSGVEILQTLAHEMVHVKQFAAGELDDGQTRWRGSVIDSDSMDYYSLPWEIEAFGLEVGMFTNFAREESLWDVFTGCRNPEATVLPEPIGWKNETIISKSQRPKAPTVSEGLNIGEVFSSDPGRCEIDINGSGWRGCTAESSSQGKCELLNRVQELSRYLGL